MIPSFKLLQKDKSARAGEVKRNATRTVLNSFNWHLHKPSHGKVFLEIEQEIYDGV